MEQRPRPRARRQSQVIRLVKVLIAVLQVAVLLGLGSYRNGETADLWEDRYRYNFVWAAPSGIALDSEIAVQVRSHIETAFLLGAGQPDSSETRKRMGIYEFASSWNVLSLQFDERAADPKWTIQGTVYAAIIDTDFYVVPLPNGPPPYDRDTHPNPWWLNVRVCVWGTGLAYGNKAGEYYSGRYAALRSGGLWVTFGMPAGGVAKPDARVSGPARYPTRDYVGDWSIVSGPGKTTPDELRRHGGPQDCRLPAEFPAAIDPVEYVEKPSVRVPAPEVRAPYPGWPE